MLGQNYSFAIRSSADSNWLASKYLWDLGDGRPVYSISNSNSTNFSYSSTGVYRVTATAMDSLDDVIAQARGVAVIGKLSAKVTITPHNSTITSYAPIVFTVSIDPNTPVYYDWNFGDGTPNATYIAYDTISHVYTQNGTYHAVATAMYDGYPAGSDTATVVVTLPTTTFPALSSMLSVTSRIDFQDGSSLEFSLPLKNSGENTFITNGKSFIASFLHSGLNTSTKREFDTTYSRITSGTLSEDGHYLTLTNSVYLDSVHSDSAWADPCSGTDHSISEHLLEYRFPTDSLVLSQVSSDSIVFRSRYSETESSFYNSYNGSYTLTGFDPYVTSWLMRMGTVSIIFRR